MPERTLDLGHVRFVTALSLMHNNNVFASNSSAHRCTAKVHRLGQPDLHCFYDFVHSAANCAGADHADAEGADGALEDGGRHGELKEREC